MERVRRVGFWLFGLALILHGFAHIPAILSAWQLKSYEDVSRQPNALIPNAGETAVALLGIIWFVAAAAFIVTGVGLLLHVDWWAPVASLATCSSLLMTILWHEDAIIGLVINIALIPVFVGVFFWTIWGPAQQTPIERKPWLHTPA
ncbi:MAG: hypothetical protein IT336_04860 [Thermomicrobiales bacterium]|nr:hypothetical protein [Thermomicrobiales bacterium]